MLYPDCRPTLVPCPDIIIVICIYRSSVHVYNARILFRHEFSLSKLETVGLHTPLFGLSFMFISGLVPRPLQLFSLQLPCSIQIWRKRKPRKLGHDLGYVNKKKWGCRCIQPYWATFRVNPSSCIPPVHLFLTSTNSHA